jgi:hypothetical protein
MTKIFAILAAGLALFLGSLFGMMLGGFGICAARLSVVSVGGTLLAALIISWLGAVTLRRRWLAAILFSIPMALGFLFAAMSHDWGRCGVVFACIVVSFAVVLLFSIQPQRPS